MKDVFAARKVSKALELCIQLARIVLNLAEEDLKDDTFRSLLLDQPEQILSLVRAIDTLRVSEAAHEQLCHVMEDAEYDPAAAARESESGLFLDLHQMLMTLRRHLEAEHGGNQRLLPTASFLIGVDGSRQSYMAFEVATRLCRQGRLTVLHVNEDRSASLQLPVISSDFIIEEYKARCSSLKLPVNRVAIVSEPGSATNFESVAEQLLHVATSSSADFLVLGAVGKGGPAVDQVGHVPRELLRTVANGSTAENGSSNTSRILVVPPAPVNAILYRQYVLVIAVDRASAQGAQCLNAALKLARPCDVLRIVHFYKKPVVGDYDEQPFEYYREVIATAKLNGTVDILPLDVGATVAESVQDYVSNQNASYLIIGKCGDGRRFQPVEAVDSGESNAVTQSKSSASGLGRVAIALLFSPRCAICVCP
ncbi:hypothetical protein Gpo141_00000695 [Globisporangium polare]